MVARTQCGRGGSPKRARRSGPRRAALAVAALGLALASVPRATAQVPPGGGPSPFPFLDATDEVALALAEIWRAGMEAPADVAAASDLYTRVAVAEETVRRHPAEATAHLAAALATLSPSDVGGYLSLLPLLRLAGEQAELVEPIYELLREAPGGEGSAGSPGTPSTAVDPEQAVRTALLGHLVELAGRGGALARRRLLDLLESADPAVRARAVAGLYRISPGREAVQREMRRRLAPEDRYLLFRY